MKIIKNKKKSIYIIGGIILIALTLLSIKGYNLLVYGFGLHHWKIFNPSDEFISASYQGKDYDFHVYGLNSLKKSQLPKQCLNVRIASQEGHLESLFGFIYSVDDYRKVAKPKILHGWMKEINSLPIPSLFKGESPSIITIAPNGIFGSTGSNITRMEKTGIILLNQVISKIKKQYDYSHICVNGSSISAQIVAGLLTKRKDVVCAVMISTPYDHKKIIRDRIKAGKRHYEIRFYQDIDVYNVIDHVSEMNFFPKQRIFLFHDPHDKIAPIYNAREMYKTLKNKGANISLVEEDSGERIDHHAFESFYGLHKLTNCAFKFNGRKKTVKKKVLNFENKKE